jgi:hypothetical protein
LFYIRQSLRDWFFQRRETELSSFVVEVYTLRWWVVLYPKVGLVFEEVTGED